MAEKKKKASWGGKRSGAGRPVGTGPGRDPDARYNRVAIMLNDAELKKYKAQAKRAKVRLATHLYSLVKAH